MSKRLEKRWQSLCEALLEEARDLGATDPQIYVEAESGLVVTDGDPQENVGYGDLRPRQDRIVISLGWPRGIRADCGAW